MHHVYAVPVEPEEGTRTPETGVTDSCEAPCGCRELNSGPLQEQYVFLTAELSLSSPQIVYALIKAMSLSVSQAGVTYMF